MSHTAALSATAKSKPVAVNFNGGTLTSDGGALLFKLADQKLQLSKRLNQIVHDPRDGARAIFHYLVKRIRQAFPDVEIILRGDAGFYSPELLNGCDRYNLKYIFGFSSNPVLERLSFNLIFAAEMFFVDGGSQEKVRLYGK